MRVAPTTQDPVTIGLEAGHRRHTVFALRDSGQILAEETLSNTGQSTGFQLLRGPFPLSRVTRPEVAGLSACGQ